MATIFEDPEIYDFVLALKHWKNRVEDEEERQSISSLIDELLLDSEKGREQVEYFRSKAHLSGMTMAQLIDSAN